MAYSIAQYHDNIDRNRNYLEAFFSSVCYDLTLVRELVSERKIVALKMSSVAERCVIVAVGLLAVVDGRPTQLVGQASNSYPPDCQEPDEYLDGKSCKMCTKCPLGFGSDHGQCGYGLGERARCVICVEGVTFQDEESATGPCKTCQLCDDNAVVIANCNKTHNTICGACKSGYGRHPGSKQLCSRCEDLSDAEKPAECPTTPQPITETSPPTPTQPSSTSSEDGDSTPHVTDLVTDVDTTIADSGTTSLNSTTIEPGMLSISAGGIVAIVVACAVLLCVIALAVFCYRKKRKQRQKPPGQSSKTEPGTVQEREILAQDGADHPADTTGNGEPCLAHEAPTPEVLDIANEVVQYSAPAAAGGDDPSPLVKNLANGVAPTGPEENAMNGTSVVVHRESTDNAQDAGENGDAVQGSVGQHDSTDGNVSPRIMTTIQEESPNIQSVQNRPTFVRQDSNKLQSIMDKITPKVKVRPSFKRCNSEPADEKESQEKLQKYVGKSWALPFKARERCNKKEEEKKKKEFDDNFDKACSKGRDMSWCDLSVKKEVNLMLLEDKMKKGNNCYKELGEKFGLDRYTALKSCNDADDVFDILATGKVPPTMEVVLQKLKEINRFDVVRKIIDDILSQKSESAAGT